MKLIVAVFLTSLFLLGCASKKDTSSAEAETKLAEKYAHRVGSATKRELVQEFGNAEWCRPQAGGETCRFYNKKGTQWLGDKKNRKSYDAFEQIIAEFDEKGILKSFEAQAQK